MSKGPSSFISLEMSIGTAFIIEPRKHAALPFVLKNALACLPESWPIVFFHGIDNVEYAHELVGSFSEKERSRIQIVNLEVDNLNQKSYSEIICTRSKIYDYIHTEYHLIFQTDSMFLKNTNHFFLLFFQKTMIMWALHGKSLIMPQQNNEDSLATVDYVCAELPKCLKLLINTIGSY